LVVADMSVPQATVAQVIKPDHLVYSGRVRFGERIQIDLRNVSALAAANDFNCVVDVS
jgi:hypothetical protein